MSRKGYPQLDGKTVAGFWITGDERGEHTLEILFTDGAEISVCPGLGHWADQTLDIYIKLAPSDGPG